MNEALCIQLAASGFTELAEELEEAATPAAQRRVLECACYAVDGALMVIRKFWNMIEVTPRNTLRNQLLAINDALVKRIAELSATYHLETKSCST